MSTKPVKHTKPLSKCYHCNGINARCKFYACAKANRVCTSCQPSKLGCCQNASSAFTQNPTTSPHIAVYKSTHRQYLERRAFRPEYFKFLITRFTTAAPFTRPTIITAAFKFTISFKSIYSTSTSSAANATALMPAAFHAIAAKRNVENVSTS